MPCDSSDTLTVLSESDRSYISTCWKVYAVVFVASFALSVYLHLHPVKDSPLSSYSGFLINGLAIPLILKHVQRAGALRVVDGLKEQCDRYPEDDARCKRIADNVDVLLRARGGVS
jgi:hypothetical protein